MYSATLSNILAHVYPINNILLVFLHVWQIRKNLLTILNCVIEKFDGIYWKMLYELFDGLPTIFIWKNGLVHAFFLLWLIFSFFLRALFFPSFVLILDWEFFQDFYYHPLPWWQQFLFLSYSFYEGWFDFFVFALGRPFFLRSFYAYFFFRALFSHSPILSLLSGLVLYITKLQFH